MRSLGARLRAAPIIISLLIAAPAWSQPVAKETPGAALARQVRVLASNPRDFNALIGAGHAALALGDVQAAAGFFGRAEEVNPNAPAAQDGNDPFAAGSPESVNVLVTERRSLGLNGELNSVETEDDQQQLAAE